MSETRIVTVKLPEEIYQEMALRIPEGDRSTFIREAIAEKLQKTPKADTLLALQDRMDKILSATKSDAKSKAIPISKKPIHNFFVK